MISPSAPQGGSSQLATAGGVATKHLVVLKRAACECRPPPRNLTEELYGSIQHAQSRGTFHAGMKFSFTDFCFSAFFIRLGVRCTRSVCGFVHDVAETCYDFLSFTVVFYFDVMDLEFSLQNPLCVLLRSCVCVLLLAARSMLCFAFLWMMVYYLDNTLCTSGEVSYHNYFT